MTGKAYYLTTLGAWQRHAGRLANSHWLALGAPASTVPAQAKGTAVRQVPVDELISALSEATPILALIEADEGAHLALQDDCEFEQLPHPLSQKPVSEAAAAALAAHGVASGAEMFDAAEAVARFHPLLRHRVF